MEPEFEFSLTLPAPGSRRLLRDVHAQLRAAILDGRLQPGLRLPTTRAFARTYGMSRNTAIAAYDLLASEGYLVTRGKAGSCVAAVLRQATAASRKSRSLLNADWRQRRPVAASTPSRWDFQLGIPDTGSFPFALWRRLAARAWRVQAKSRAAYADAQGQPSLRAAIAQHVAFARAVACAADDIVVTSGAQQAFDLLARILVTAGRTLVAVENPGYPPARAAFAAAGAEVFAAPVDAEGLIVERLPRNVRVIYATPSHQFPLGMAMSARRRAELLEFARRHHAVVIEDDYDGEFRFGGRPLDALQTLDRNACVFYVGTFSKSLFPALRLGFVVAPAWARAALTAAKQAADAHCPVVEQETLAAFIGAGHLARHVRKMRRIYAARRQRLLDAIGRDFGRWLEPVASTAGLHLSTRLRSSMDAEALVERARAVDVGVQSLRGFYAGRPTPALAFGYGAIDAAAIGEALLRLRDVFPG